MQEWTNDYVRRCCEHARTQSNACVLRGAAFHGNRVLYVFLSTLNIFHAVRYTLPKDKSELYSWSCINPNELDEYYSEVKFEKVDLRTLGYGLEGTTYRELCEDEEDGRED